MKKDFISLSNLSPHDFIELLSLSHVLKHTFKSKPQSYVPLKGKTMGLIFEKPSTRTSTSFAVGVYQLGGLPLMLSAQDLQLHRGESMADTARVLSRYVDIIMLRANMHRSVVEFSSFADVPVINGLTDKEHPCQILSDLFTIIEKKLLKGNKASPNFWKNLSFKNMHLAYVGDGNNIAHSWIHAAAILGLDLTIACPEGYEPDRDVLLWSALIAKKSGSCISIVHDPRTAVRDADIVYTDVWTSMGKEKEKESRIKIFQPYQVNRDLVHAAKKDVIVMHCMPAHRGEEMTDEVIDGKHSVVIDEAENRLHVQKAVIVTLMKKGRK